VIVHHGPTQRVEVESLLESVLETYDLFWDTKSWTRRLLESTSAFDALGVDGRMDALLYKLERAIDILRPSVLKRFFGFNKRTRRYLCPNALLRVRTLV
jgi:hypothetical protein